MFWMLLTASSAAPLLFAPGSGPGKVSGWESPRGPSATLRLPGPDGLRTGVLSGARLFQLPLLICGFQGFCICRFNQQGIQNMRGTFFQKVPKSGT